jgi:hypothetical protein
MTTKKQKQKQKQKQKAESRKQKAKQKQKQKQIPPLRCGMTNKRTARNDKQKNKQKQRHPTLRDETAKDGAPSSFAALRDLAPKNGVLSCSAT